MGFEISGQVALVTGAGRGIGEAITDKLLREGAAKVYGAVRQLDQLETMVAEHPHRLVPLSMDLTVGESITAAAATASDVTLVINNAGILQNASALADDAIDDLKYTMDANVYGLLRIAQAFAPVLKANGGGAFVQLNSIASLRGSPKFSTYCASKAAAYSLTQALRALLFEQGTHVLSVHPGPIATDMGSAAGFGEEAEPPSVVADALVDGLRHGAFHVFPDTMASKVGAAYQSFAEKVIEYDLDRS